MIIDKKIMKAVLFYLFRMEEYEACEVMLKIFRKYFTDPEFPEDPAA